MVDDDIQVLELGKDMLERDMFSVERTTDPHEAYSLFLQNDYDAVISDYEMPEMNGGELLEEIREVDEETPFFIHTGKDIQEIAIGETRECITEYYRKVGLERYRELADSIKNCSGLY